MQKTAGLYHVSNEFNDISGAAPGTIFEQKWGNTIQGELGNAVSLGMSLVAPGTAESDPSYRDTQLATLLKAIIAGQWYINTASKTVQQSGIIEAQTGIASDNDLNMAICRNNAVGPLSLIDSDNYGLIWYPGVSDTNIRKWSAIEYGNGVFMAIAEAGGASETERVARRLVSGSWTNIGPTTGTGNPQWRSLATDSAGNWVICGTNSGGNQVYYSPDNGATWYAATTAAVHASTATWYAAAYGAGTFMIGGQDSSGNPLIYLSTDDGDNWVAASTPPGGDRNVQSLAYHQTGSSGEWIAAMGAWYTTRDQNIYRSYGSGDVWTAVALPLGTNEQFHGMRARVFDDMIFIPGFVNNLVSVDSFPALLKYADVNNHYCFCHIPTSDVSVLNDIAKAKTGYIMVGQSSSASNYEYMIRSANIT